MDVNNLVQQGLQLVATAVAIYFALVRSISNIVSTVGEPVIRRAVERHIGFLDSMQTYVQSQADTLQRVAQVQHMTLQEVRGLAALQNAAASHYEPPAG